jgi:two-component system nitrogen regulation response regulator GlnG
MDNQTLRHIPVNMCLKNNNQCLTLTVVFHPDVYRIGEQCKQLNSSVEISRTSPLFGNINSAQSKKYRRPLNDRFISRTPILISKNDRGWLLEKNNSSTDLSTLEQDNIQSLLLTESMLQKGFLITLVGRIVLLVHYSHNMLDDNQSCDLVGVSDNLAKIRTLISRVAVLKAPVLICGESGTGKELIAKALHHYSKRNDHKLISINMAAIPSELVATELFGNIKGAFTGAMMRKGCFQQADQSSLFLDEIGEAPAKVQIALLRALETGIVQSVGSDKEQRLDVRVIAATDANLEDLIERNSFKVSLLQRLSGLVIDVLPLRKRPEDIGIILSKFLIEFLEETGQLDKLVNADDSQYYYWAWFYAQCCVLQWPGNVRQIKNTSTQLSLLLMGHPHLSSFDWLSFVQRITSISLDDTQASLEPTQKSDVVGPIVKRKPRDISDEEIISTLANNDWQIKSTAEQLNVSRASLYLRIDANPNIRRAGDLSLAELNSAFSTSSGDLDMMVNTLKISKSALKRRLKEIGLSY